MRKVLVTGSSGLIGGALVADLLQNGFQVAGVDKREPDRETSPPVNYVCDIIDKARLTSCIREFAPDAIVHLAARTDLHGRTVKDYSANVEGVSNLVEAIRLTPSVRRCIWTSSQLVCRVGHPPHGPLDYDPDTVYGQSKVRTEEIVRAANGADREWCIVRPTTVWGPGVSPHYRRFLSLVRRGLYFHVDRGPLFKSYSYVGNITHQYIALLDAPAAKIQGRTLYLADYTPIDLVEWCNAFQRAFEARRIPVMPRAAVRSLAWTGDLLESFGLKNAPFSSVRLKNMLTQYQFDMRETEEICGPLPYTVDDGVRKTIEWINRLPSS